MRIFDAHNHSNIAREFNPEKFISDLKSVGISGSCVFSSNMTREMYGNEIYPFEKRLENVLAWTQGHDNLFPVMWINPFEKNIKKNVRKAADSGILAFKFICDNYYPDHKKCRDILKVIADTGKPAIFHTGMLWGKDISIKYNRPINFEFLADMDGLKVALCHGGWPWCEEEIALYGRILYANKYGHGADVYLDLCPGTPKISRYEMFEKMFAMYPVEDKIMFGVDSGVHTYDTNMAAEYIKNDMEILDKLEVSEEVKEKYFGKNLFKFLGIEEPKDC